MASPELPVQTLLERRGGGSDNVVFRGVLPVALAVHDQIHLIAGRMFRPGLNEVMVGAGLVNRYKDCARSARRWALAAGRGRWSAFFAAGGSSFESEVWGDIHNVQDEATRRGAYYACARPADSGRDAVALTRRIADDPRINLQAQTESDHYKDEAVVARQLRALMMVVATIMAIGAVFGAMNTMYAAVAARTAGDLAPCGRWASARAR